MEKDFRKMVEDEMNSFDWRKTLTVGRGGIPIASIENYVKYFENDPKYRGRMKYNEFTNRKEIHGRDLRDGDYAIINRDIETDLGALNITYVENAIKVIYEKHAYNPLTDYIKGLKWDGRKRIETLFIDLLGADDTKLVRYMTKTWMIAAIKRALIPGCKFDNMIILTGAQGTGKTTLCELLSKGYYSNFSFDVTSENNKDGKITLNSTWIAIFDELSAWGRKEVGEIKKFLSVTEDKARKPYAREDSFFKRRNVFIGSTNDDKFLNDSTGNRRFWCIECHKTKKDTKVGDTMTPEFVDQLWAEAYWYYRTNPDIYLDIPYDMQEDFETSQDKFNSVYNDASASFLDFFLDKKFNINEEGEVYEYEDVMTQDELGNRINKIPIHVISQVLTNEKFHVKNVKNLVGGLKGWEYKNAKYKNLGRKAVLSLVRKEPIVQGKKTAFDPMSAFDHLNNANFHGFRG